MVKLSLHLIYKFTNQPTNFLYKNITILMKGFFINGTFSVDTNKNYSMRFLYELEYDFILNIYTDKKKIYY